MTTTSPNANPLLEILQEVVNDMALQTNDQRDGVLFEKVVDLVVNPYFLTLVPVPQHRVSLIRQQLNLSTAQFDRRFDFQDDNKQVFMVIRLELQKEVNELLPKSMEWRAQVEKDTHEQQRLIIEIVTDAVKQNTCNDDVPPPDEKRRKVEKVPRSDPVEDLAHVTDKITSDFEDIRKRFADATKQEQRASRLLPLYEAYSEACQRLNNHRRRLGDALFQLWELVGFENGGNPPAQHQLRDLQEQIRENHDIHKSLLRDLDARLLALQDEYAGYDDMARLKSIVRLYSEKFGPDPISWTNK